MAAPPSSAENSRARETASCSIVAAIGASIKSTSEDIPLSSSSPPRPNIIAQPAICAM